MVLKIMIAYSKTEKIISTEYQCGRICVFSDKGRQTHHKSVVKNKSIAAKVTVELNTVFIKPISTKKVRRKFHKQGF